MRLLFFFLLVAQLCLPSPVNLKERQVYALVGDGFEQAAMTLGSYYNYWRINDGVFDLTRSDRSPTTTPKTLPMMGSRSAIKIEPNRTALVIIDMQNFFLHPELSPKATNGRGAIQPTVNMIKGFRKHGMKILWTNVSVLRVKGLFCSQQRDIVPSNRIC